MNRYKLLALDMDGTTLNNDGELSDETAKWLLAAADAGMIVCFCTARIIQDTLPFALQLGLNAPLVTVSGGEVWSAPGMLSSRKTMDPEDVSFLRRLAEESGAEYVALGVEGKFDRHRWPEDIGTVQWLEFWYFSDDRDVRETIKRTLGTMNRFEIANSHPDNLEITPKGATKEKGLREVCRLLNIRIDEVVAIGDGLNDIAMIEAAGLGVAMGNAQPEVKLAADRITLTNEEGGVAAVIRGLLEKGEME